MNAASDAETKILRMAERINERARNKAGIMRGERRIWDTERTSCLYRQGVKLLEYEPKIELEKGVKETIQWLQNPWREIIMV